MPPVVIDRRLGVVIERLFFGVFIVVVFNESIFFKNGYNDVFVNVGDERGGEFLANFLFEVGVNGDTPR